MRNLRLNDIMTHLKGEIIQGTESLMIKNVVTKAHRVEKNTLFFCLKTKINITDLHHANAIITEKPDALIKTARRNLTIIKVKDIKKAYWDFVQYYRSLFDIPVIGITGTCGKTTTTEMVKAILSGKYKVHATSVGKNALFRNLPYLLDIDDTTQAAVFELGVTHPGNITESCLYFRPQIGILLNIGTYHLKGCKTLTNYIKAKGELLDGLTPNGTLILNADDELIQGIDLSTFMGKILYIGFGQQAQYRARNVRYTKGGMKFTLRYLNKDYPYFVPGYGEHNVYNALAAIAASHLVGIDFKEIKTRLAAFTEVEQHMQLRQGLNGCTVIDDTWNCTPPSMEAALKVLKLLKNKLYLRKSIVVLGYMPQLGEQARNQYNKIGEKVAESGVDILITLGDDAKQISNTALEKGFAKNKVYNCHTANEIFAILQKLMDRNTLVLFKFPYKYRLSKDPFFRKLMKDLFPL
ncbi:MAG: UDP-N-acetylmuramoyl-tripeptide--D-alanyl-D-alanine ligase [Thermincolia bacterium]